MRTGPTNPQLQQLIAELRSAAYADNVMLWKRVADDLERPSRNRRVVNISRLSRSTKANDLVVVPGKVLGSGDIAHKVTVAAWQFSSGAADKVAKNGGSALSLSDFLKQKPDVKKVKIIG